MKKYNVSRGSYNVSFEAGLGDSGSVASQPGDQGQGVKTLACDGNFGSESKC